MAGGGMMLSLDLSCTHVYGQGTKTHGAFLPNAWLRIYPDNKMVFMLDRNEMGQGVMTSSAMMVAEELEVSPDELTIEFAPEGREYNNTLFGVHATGGSTSTMASFPILREAGANARELLRAAAAKEWRVPLDEVVANEGRLSAPGKNASYGEMATRAAGMRIAKVTLKKPSEWKVLGKPHGRLDARPKVDGSAQFGIDVKIPGMLTAVVVRAPITGGKVKSFDAKEALALKGVEHVVEIPNGVAVVAKNYWLARRASNLLKVEFEGADESISTQSLHDAFAKRLDEEAATVTQEGDAKSTLEGAAQKISATYEVPYLQHAPMEPMNATARVAGDRCDVWAPTQGPAVCHEIATRVTGLDYDQVHIHPTYLGGGFGRRGMIDFVEEAVRISKATGATVKVVWSREDDMKSGFLRPATLSRFEGAVSDGKISAWSHTLAGQSVLFSASKSLLSAIPPEWLSYVAKDYMTKQFGNLLKSGSFVDPTPLEGASELPYDIENFDMHFAQHEPPIPVGFWRAVGHSSNGFIVESFVDELAHLAKVDPFVFRQKALHQSPRHLAVLNLAAEKAGWGKALPPGVFRGIAKHASFGSYVAQVVELSIENGQAKVHRVVCAVDCGRPLNPDIIKAQMEGGIIFGLSAALKQGIDFENGAIVQENFHDYRMLRMHEAPAIETHIVQSEEKPGGIGEVGLPPIAAAVGNAIFAATNVRLRKLPLEPEVQRAFLDKRIKNTRVAARGEK